MSEYQFYEFQSIDRPLQDEDIEAIHQYSSRVQVNRRKAIFEYSYSDFRYDEVEVLRKHFDMMIYMANWGTRRLLIKFPRESVSLENLKKYEIEGDGGLDEYTKIISSGSYVIIDIYMDAEDGSFWIDGEDLLDEMLALRKQIIEGDYRLLYLAWMNSAFLSNAKNLIEPPLPPNMKKLDKALQSFVDFWEIDEDWIAVASQASPSQKKPPLEDVIAQISQLNALEKDQYLALLLQDPNQAYRKLYQQLMDFLPNAAASLVLPNRTVKEFQAAFKQQAQLRIQKEKEAEAEKKAQRMAQIDQELPQLWEQAQENASLKHAGGYKKATEILVEIRDYFDYHENADTFQQELEKKMEPFGKSRAFRDRLEEKGILLPGK